ncbi:MAG: hypothetical protein WC506_03030 [Candidatus Micrarchaeia archaeon]
MRRRIEPLKPSALAVGALIDGSRVFFIVKKNHLGIECLELPCVLVHGNSDPVGALKDEFAKIGIDAHVKGIIAQGTHNAGSRKKKHNVPALVFEVSAKSPKPSLAPGSGVTGYKWLALEQARRMKLSRMSEWLRLGWTN